jgi:hypothetical protein
MGWTERLKLSKRSSDILLRRMAIAHPRQRTASRLPTRYPGPYLLRETTRKSEKRKT